MASKAQEIIDRLYENMGQFNYPASADFTPQLMAANAARRRKEKKEREKEAKEARSTSESLDDPMDPLNANVRGHRKAIVSNAIGLLELFGKQQKPGIPLVGRIEQAVRDLRTISNAEQELAVDARFRDIGDVRYDESDSKRVS